MSEEKKTLKNIFQIGGISNLKRGIEWNIEEFMESQEVQISLEFK